MAPLKLNSLRTTKVNQRETLYSRWLGWGGLLAVGMGLLSLCGWAFEMDLLARIHKGLIPMAPSTAVLFVWFGAGVYLRTARSLSDRFLRVYFLASCLALLVSFLLLISSSLGIYSKLEYLGMNISGEVKGAPIGHMSPVTAICFIFTGLSFIACLRDKVSFWVTLLAFSVSGLLVLISFVYLIGYVLGTPFLYGGIFIPPALNTILSFLALGIPLFNLGEFNP